MTDTLDVAGRLQSDGVRSRDRRGYDDVFALDMTTAYSGRDRVERYRGANPADVVKDLVGVFSGDARNSGALDINIRGIQGRGGCRSASTVASRRSRSGAATTASATATTSIPT